MSQWDTYLADHQARFVGELIEFLKIPSVSALPEHADDVQAAGEWVAKRMTAAGIEHCRVMPTDGHPVVYGDWLHAPGKPTILIYGHFDVQPADPYELWDSPPFEPKQDGDRLYARGATDDKGNMLTPILAVEALLQSEGTLPVNLKFCFEGQEEIGSPQLPDFVANQVDLLACDMVVSSDGLQWGETEPAIWLTLRGMCALQIDLKGAKTDLHSGSYGGTIQNPIHTLTHILATMHDADGTITVDGFLDDVVELSAEERAEIARVPFDEKSYLAGIGVSELFGEPGYTTYERNWVRPTLEINGIWGGFQAEGIKTVLPNEAHAKITCRLAANQDPDKIFTAISAHVHQHTPPGMTASVTYQGGAQPYAMPSDHPGNDAARVVLQELYGVKPYDVGIGGSIPVCGLFLQHLNAYTVNFAFGLPDEPMHAPNEFFRLSSYHKAQRGYCMLLHELAQTQLDSTP
ncbi:MAG: dipeptidase [Chloroflexota bacterium]